MSSHTQLLGPLSLPHHKEWGTHTTAGWITPQHKSGREGNYCSWKMVAGSWSVEVFPIKLGSLLTPMNAAAQLQVTERVLYVMVESVDSRLNTVEVSCSLKA